MDQPPSALVSELAWPPSLSSASPPRIEEPPSISSSLSYRKEQQHQWRRRLRCELSIPDPPFKLIVVHAKPSPPFLISRQWHFR
ncbi:hypothetical protein QYF36_024614 [Acer negundo]|nr:hypothetical protein QYF36_024614 [Acer negundo]